MGAIEFFGNFEVVDGGVSAVLWYYDVDEYGFVDLRDQHLNKETVFFTLPEFLEVMESMGSVSLFYSELEALHKDSIEYYEMLVDYEKVAQELVEHSQEEMGYEVWEDRKALEASLLERLEKAEKAKVASLQKSLEELDIESAEDVLSWLGGARA